MTVDNLLVTLAPHQPILPVAVPSHSSTLHSSLNSSDSSPSPIPPSSRDVTCPAQRIPIPSLQGIRPATATATATANSKTKSIGISNNSVGLNRFETCICSDGSKPRSPILDLHRIVLHSFGRCPVLRRTQQATAYNPAALPSPSCRRHALWMSCRNSPPSSPRRRR